MKTVTAVVCFVFFSYGVFTAHGYNHIVSSTNEFGFELLRLLSKQHDRQQSNLFFSPASLSLAVGLVYLGAQEKTAEQISTSMNWPDSEQVHYTFKALHESMRETEHQGLVVKMANRIWGHDQMEIGAEFMENARDFYSADLTKADFASRPEEARQEINRWVEENTAYKIRDFIPPGTFNSNTRLALINAIYFKGAWLNEFQQRKTFHGRFYVSGSREEVVEVEMMSRTSKHNFYQDDDSECQVLELPYSGQDHSMIIILPTQRDGIERLEETLTDEKFARWITLLKNVTTEVAIPKFRLTQQFELNQILPQLGIKDLFEAGKADLSGISPFEDLYVSHIIHKAHVEVNEEGTEAAAASGVVMQKRSLDLHPVFYADHPFIFVIYQKSSSSVLFLGKVIKPNTVRSNTEAENFTHDGNEL